MHNTESLTTAFCNFALMEAFYDTDCRMIVAFEQDDHKTIGKFAALYEALIENVINHIPADNV
jgi:hypothetical protein